MPEVYLDIRFKSKNVLKKHFFQNAVSISHDFLRRKSIAIISNITITSVILFCILAIIGMVTVIDALKNVVRDNSGAENDTIVQD